MVKTEVKYGFDGQQSMSVAIETCECATWHNNTIMNREG